MELDPKVRDQETAMVKGGARAIGLVKVRRLEERKELRKKPRSKPDLKTRIEGLRTIARAQTKKAGANIIVGLHILCPGLFFLVMRRYCMEQQKEKGNYP
jgi:hypothetical protein